MDDPRIHVVRMRPVVLRRIESRSVPRVVWLARRLVLGILNARVDDTRLHVHQMIERHIARGPSSRALRSGVADRLDDRVHDDDGENDQDEGDHEGLRVDRRPK